MRHNYYGEEEDDINESEEESSSSDYIKFLDAFDEFWKMIESPCDL